MSKAALASPLVITAPATKPSMENAPSASPADQTGADRREHRRHPLADIPSISKVRLKYGPAVALIDLSNGGAQIETTNYRMQPGSTVVVEITAAGGDLAIPAKVLRCQLASLLPEPIYRGALVFKQPFDVGRVGITAEDEAIDDAAAEPDPGTLDPAAELEKLRSVLARVTFGTGGAPDGTEAALGGALDASLATLDSSGGRRAGRELAEELAELFQAVAGAFERTPTATALMLAIEEHLRHVVPARAIRLADSGSYQQVAGAEAILMTIPRLAADAPVARLAVEFAEGSEPQELHFLILRAGIQLVAVAGELGRLIGTHTPITVRGMSGRQPQWSREVA